MNNKIKKIITRFGIAGLVFFTVKGLVWLFFGGAVVKFILDWLDKT